MADKEENALSASLRLAGGREPTTTANALKVESELGIPADVTLRNSAEVKAIQIAREAPDAREIFTRSPYLAEYMLDPNRAALTRDALPSLMEFESSVMSDRPGIIGNTLRLVGNRTNQLTGNFLQAVSSVMTAARDSVPTDPFTGLVKDLVLRSGADESLRNIGVAVEEGEAYDYVPEFTFERMLDSPTPANIAGLMFEQGVGSVPDMLAAMYALPAYVTSLSQEIASERAANNGDAETDLTDIATALPLATAISFLDRFSTRGMLGVLADRENVRTVRQVGAEMLRSTAREAGTEFVQESAQALGETLGTDAGRGQGVTGTDSTQLYELADMFSAAARRGLEGAVVGAGMGGSVRGATATYQAIANARTRSLTQEMSSRFAQADLDVQITAMENTFRQTSMPEFQSYLNTLPGGLYLTPDVVAAAEAAKVTLPESLLGKAGSQYQDIPITYADIAPLIDDEKLWPIIRQRLKRRPEEMTQNELQETAKARGTVEGDTAAAIIERAAREKQVLTEADKIFREVKKAIVATGRQSPQMAAYTAELVPAYVTSVVSEYRAAGVEIGVREAYDVLGLRVEAMGEPTAGSVKQTAPSTPEFREWFGDSKVVDEKGEPLVVYHGTDSDFESFDSAKTGDVGFYFAQDPRAAEQFTRGMGAVVPAYVSITNPAPEAVWRAEYDKASGGNPRKQAHAALQKQGYDGILRPGEIVAFSNTQIKSAIGNRGTYDPNDPNILRQQPLGSDGGEVTINGQRGLLSKNTIPGELPWRLTWFDDSEEDGGVAGHIDIRGTQAARILKGKSVLIAKDSSEYAVEPVTRTVRQQPDGGAVLGETEFTDTESVVRLAKAADPSTMLHELAHVFLEGERRMAAKYGALPRQQAVLDMLGLTSWDQVQRPHHEQFARTFETYLMEGKAPSRRLRDAFAAFARWLAKVYHGILSLKLKDEALALTPEVTAVFDRLLATQTELEEALASPEYAPLFKSQKQAGMTDKEWEDYQKRVQRRNDAGQMDMFDKLLAEFRKWRTREWQEERQGYYDEELARLKDLPVHSVMAALQTGNLNASAVSAITGGKIPPGRILSNSKTNGDIDPDVLAEAYGYDSTLQMLEDIQNYTRNTTDVASQAADQRMQQKYGDILNDGSIEAQAREAFQNEEQAALLISEIKTLRKRTRDTSNDIDTAGMEAAAEATVERMTASELRPSRFYSAMKRAARAAATERNPAKQRELKLQELANHYLYRASLTAQRDTARIRAYVKAVQRRDYSPREVDTDYIQGLKWLSGLYDARTPRRRQREFTKLTSWFETQVQVRPDLQPFDYALASALKQRATERAEGKPVTTQFTPKAFHELTVGEQRGLYEQLRNLRYVGGKNGASAKEALKAERERVAQALRDAAGGKRAPTRDAPSTLSGVAADASHLLNSLLTFRNLLRELDGYKPGGTATDVEGEAWRQFGVPVYDAQSRKVALKREVAAAFEAELNGISDLTMRQDGAIKSTTLTKRKAEGGTWSLDEAGRVMLAVYWGEEGNRKAIRDGHSVTDADVEAMLAELTDPQVQLVNAIWKLNEHLWPQMSQVAHEVYGAVPPRTTPLPYTIRGQKLTGGHMTLYYKDVPEDASLIDGQSFFDEAIAPGRTTALHERKGSGGRVVNLDKNNIFRSLEDNIHYVAFAKVGSDLQGLIGSAPGATQIRDAIRDVHGEGFLRAFTESLQGLTTNRRHRETFPILATLSRTLRRARTVGYLAYSPRNTLQQLTSIPIIMDEIGGAEYMAQAAALYASGDARTQIAFIQGKSAMMASRSKFVNRESAEILKDITIGSGRLPQAWNWYKKHGFTPQAVVDMLLAYPAWMSRYEAEMHAHGDEKRAARAADVLVGETVGSGDDIFLSGAYRSNQQESIRFLTAMGSWANIYLNRIVTKTKGGRQLVTPQSMTAVFSVPLMISVLSATLVQDGPEKDEGIGWWLASKYGDFMFGLAFLARDIWRGIKGFDQQSQYEAVVGLVPEAGRAVEQMTSGEVGPAGVASTGLRAVGAVVPIGGSGTLIRVLDYVESYEQGNEDRIESAGDAAREVHQALVEGADRND